MGIEKVMKKYTIHAQPSDFMFWKEKSHEERLEALEQIRREYHSWRYDAEQGFQRIYGIFQRKQGQTYFFPLKCNVFGA